jgi:hypothetical protein
LLLGSPQHTTSLLAAQTFPKPPQKNPGGLQLPFPSQMKYRGVKGASSISPHAVLYALCRQVPPPQPSLQLPEQSLSQQTFVVAPDAVSEQWPLPHSVSVVQGSLFARALHWPLVHTGVFFGHSASEQQALVRVQVWVPGQLR